MRLRRLSSEHNCTYFQECGVSALPIISTANRITVFGELGLQNLLTEDFYTCDGPDHCHEFPLANIHNDCRQACKKVIWLQKMIGKCGLFNGGSALRSSIPSLWSSLLTECKSCAGHITSLLFHPAYRASDCC